MASDWQPMTSRAYFYHLKFELYNTPTPSSVPEIKADRAPQTDIYLPPPGTNIFTTPLPSHKRPAVGQQDIQKKHISTSGEPTFGTVIDCGLATEQAASVKAGPHDRATPNAHIPNPSIAVKDWRFGPVRVESVNMGPPEYKGKAASINAGPRSLATKARFDPVSGTGIKNTDLGWGVVHLYRDGEETRGLNDTRIVGEGMDSAGKEDTTILCIPAVPSYMTPSDFLGWVGESTREEVSHFRMVMTGSLNRYLVLMKFRDGEVARRWRAEWTGKVFSGMEPENCHVMFIKSIVFQTSQGSSSASHESSFPDMNHDPFTPNLSGTIKETTSGSLGSRPLPPPTASLVELPTCPVCLERMDDTTGLLTILCQHVFHCACLQKWKGSGCPVCRHTQPHSSLNRPFGVSASDMCQTCDCPDDLWICLICGNVGCGRYKGGHAKEHWKETTHEFALEIETQHVWDYSNDTWVHRLIQNKGDGKLVELPSNRHLSNSNSGFGESRVGYGGGYEDVEMVPRTKFDGMGMEYTHLLSSQLESQRVYFEDIVKKAVDKASESSKAAEEAAAKAESALSQLHHLSLEHAKLKDDIVPSLEKERDRVATKAEKSAELARSMARNFQEEKQVGKGLMERISHINEGMMSMSKELTALKAENADLKDQNRDLSFFISSQDKVKSMEGELGEEIVEGTLSLPPEKKSKGKGKGKAK